MVKTGIKSFVSRWSVRNKTSTAAAVAEEEQQGGDAEYMRKGLTKYLQNASADYGKFDDTPSVAPSIAEDVWQLKQNDNEDAPPDSTTNDSSHPIRTRMRRRGSVACDGRDRGPTTGSNRDRDRDNKDMKTRRRSHAGDPGRKSIRRSKSSVGAEGGEGGDGKPEESARPTPRRSTPRRTKSADTGISDAATSGNSTSGNTGRRRSGKQPPRRSTSDCGSKLSATGTSGPRKGRRRATVTDATAPAPRSRSKDRVKRRGSVACDGTDFQQGQNATPSSGRDKDKAATPSSREKDNSTPHGNRERVKRVSSGGSRDNKSKRSSVKRTKSDISGRRRSSSTRRRSSKDKTSLENLEMTTSNPSTHSNLAVSGSVLAPPTGTSGPKDKVQVPSVEEMTGLLIDTEVDTDGFPEGSPKVDTDGFPERVPKVDTDGFPEADPKDKAKVPSVEASIRRRSSKDKTKLENIVMSTSTPSTYESILAPPTGVSEPREKVQMPSVEEMTNLSIDMETSIDTSPPNELKIDDIDATICSDREPQKAKELPVVESDVDLTEATSGSSHTTVEEDAGVSETTTDKANDRESAGVLETTTNEDLGYGDFGQPQQYDDVDEDDVYSDEDENTNGEYSEEMEDMDWDDGSSCGDEHDDIVSALPPVPTRYGRRATMSCDGRYSLDYASVEIDLGYGDEGKEDATKTQAKPSLDYETVDIDLGYGVDSSQQTHHPKSLDEVLASSHSAARSTDSELMSTMDESVFVDQNGRLKHTCDSVVLTKVAKAEKERAVSQNRKKLFNTRTLPKHYAAAAGIDMEHQVGRPRETQDDLSVKTPKENMRRNRRASMGCSPAMLPSHHSKETPAITAKAAGEDDAANSLEKKLAVVDSKCATKEKDLSLAFLNDHRSFLKLPFDDNTTIASFGMASFAPSFAPTNNSGARFRAAMSHRPRQSQDDMSVGCQSRCDLSVACESRAPDFDLANYQTPIQPLQRVSRRSSMGSFGLGPPPGGPKETNLKTQGNDITKDHTSLSLLRDRTSAFKLPFDENSTVAGFSVGTYGRRASMC